MGPVSALASQFLTMVLEEATLIRVLIADDHAIIRRGVKDILEDLAVALEVDETDSVQSTLKRIISAHYDILLLDISFPDGSGLDVLAQVQALSPDTRVLVLSMYPEQQFARRVLRTGAQGYLTKDSAPTELIAAVKKVLAGGKYVTQSLAEQLASDLASPGSRTALDLLSDREYQVFRAIASGKTIAQIAAELALSPKTVSTYRSRLMQKLNLGSTAELVRCALEEGL